mmetsp:Transcript_17189/g.42866  ORF Transcript_17189/g.42866 Transcript_17189/m.42866 type:complete len:96 (-) Transcript_17189:153-440(-)
MTLFAEFSCMLSAFANPEERRTSSCMNRCMGRGSKDDSNSTIMAIPIEGGCWNGLWLYSGLYFGSVPHSITQVVVDIDVAVAVAVAVVVVYVYVL